MKITYTINKLPAINEIIDLYKSAGLNRPVADHERIATMYAHSNLVVAAWHDTKLVGVARSLTDFCYCCYVSDLAVRQEYKCSGIGKKLIGLTKEQVGAKSNLLLLAAPEAIDYYPKIGLEKADNGFIIKRLE